MDRSLQIIPILPSQKPMARLKSKNVPPGTYKLTAWQESPRPAGADHHHLGISTRPGGFSLHERAISFCDPTPANHRRDSAPLITVMEIVPPSALSLFPSIPGKSSAFSVPTAAAKPPSSASSPRSSPRPPGKIKLLGLDLAENRDELRKKLGVVFQSPSLDKQLTAEENLRQQGRLLWPARGRTFSKRIDDLLNRVGLTDRLGTNALDPLQRRDAPPCRASQGIAQPPVDPTSRRTEHGPGSHRPHRSLAIPQANPIRWRDDIASPRI